MQDRLRHRMRGNADRHRIEPGGSEIGHRAVSCLLGSTSVSGPGQNAWASAVACRIEAGDPQTPPEEVADMGDQRIEGDGRPLAW